jgi:hypothetical protein
MRYSMLRSIGSCKSVSGCLDVATCVNTNCLTSSALYPSCHPQSYFSSDDDQNAYLSEMSSITSSALTYLTTLAHQQPWASSNRRPLVVLGVDDTALSNLQFFGLGSDFRTKSGPAFAGPYNRRRSMLGMGAAHAGGAAGLSEAQRSLLENDGDSGSSTDRLVLGPGWGQAVNLPALSPVLQLYTQLQGLGYAVAFVTSRSEGTRANTTANLASAGGCKHRRQAGSSHCQS